MTPKQFLIFSGMVLVLLAILGAIGITGPTAEQSIFGASWWFDPGENMAHLILGLVSLISAFILPARIQKLVLIVIGVIALILSSFSITGSRTVFGQYFENPTDTGLHIALAIGALLSAFMGKKNSMMPM